MVLFITHIRILIHYNIEQPPNEVEIRNHENNLIRICYKSLVKNKRNSFIIIVEHLIFNQLNFSILLILALTLIISLIR